ncbi:MAG: hypothetical protein LBJ63_00790, partial [Prevotellaceae bacterium]|nr:hypothetical protein [Prevotellaceae bacterium]
MAEQAINVNSVPTQNPTANTKLVGVENGNWVQVPASNVGGSGIMIPELILKPMLIPHTAIPHTTDNELYIWCKFPQDA